jgi:molybdopterin synthase sulfur carrier subunit|tara:strand:- start:780 stop:1025 length:246 start_codon:yes stop_codon:yes gene_type:complete
MIKIKIKCFSQVRYAMGKDEIIIDIEDGSTTSDLESFIIEKVEGKLDNISLRVAVNQKYVQGSIELKDGDEVAFIPPVQGG